MAKISVLFIESRVNTEIYSRNLFTAGSQSVYMSYMKQNFCLFQVWNLSGLNFRFFFCSCIRGLYIHDLHYPCFSVAATRAGAVPARQLAMRDPP